jgi:PPOX class probable F420-dependent enzyme
MARKDITMTEDEIHEFLSNGHTLQVATIGIDGFPHLAPMWYRFEEGKIVFRSFTKSQKVVNLMRNPKITVLLEDGRSYDQLRGVMIKGTATLITDRDYVLGLYGRVSSDYEMAAGVRRDFSDEEVEAMFGRIAAKNTAVVVEPTNVISWDHRKLDGAY